MQVILTAAQIAQLEDEVQTLVQVLSYSAPLLGGLFVIYAATYRYVMGAIKSNHKLLASIEANTNGKLTAMANQIQEVHDATFSAQTTGDGSTAASDGTTQRTGSGTAAVPAEHGPEQL